MSVLEPLYAPFASSAAVLLWPALFLLLSRQLRRRAWFWPYVALSLPGTVLHELLSTSKQKKTSMASYYKVDIY